MSLQIKGTIPAWAAGSLYRTGPGMSAVEDTKKGTHYVSHWFDGLAHTHKFDISAAGDGASVTYSSRRQADEVIADIKRRGWRTGVSFGQKADPCVGLYAKAMTVFKPSVNNNVVVQRNLPGFKAAPAGGHRTATNNIVLTTDNSLYDEIDPDTLEPIGTAEQTKLHPDLRGPLSCAHAQRDPETGDLFNINLQIGPRPAYRVFRVDATTGKTDILATVAGFSVAAAYMHSFFLTDNYVVFCIPSSHFSLGGAKIPLQGNLLEAMKPFSKANKCKWFVVDRRHGGGVVAQFSTPAGFFFHSINAFEEHVDGKSHILLDYVHFDTTDVMLGMYYDVILNRDDAAKKHWLGTDAYLTHNPRLVRLRMALHDNNKAVEEMSIPGPHAGDLPSINPEYACKPYRYVYSTANRGLSTMFDALVKTDLRSRDALLWCGPTGHCPGEPVFVARPGGVDEDDGVVLCVVLDGSLQKSYLLCLDARTMEETGRAEADFAIAVGLHGVHAPVVA